MRTHAAADQSQSTTPAADGYGHYPSHWPTPPPPPAWKMEHTSRNMFSSSGSGGESSWWRARIVCTLSSSQAGRGGPSSYTCASPDSSTRVQNVDGLHPGGCTLHMHGSDGMPVEFGMGSIVARLIAAVVSHRGAGLAPLQGRFQRLQQAAGSRGLLAQNQRARVGAFCWRAGCPLQGAPHPAQTEGALNGGHIAGQARGHGVVIISKVAAYRLLTICSE